MGVEIREDESVMAVALKKLSHCPYCAAELKINMEDAFVRCECCGREMEIPRFTQEEKRLTQAVEEARESSERAEAAVREAAKQAEEAARHAAERIEQAQRAQTSQLANLADAERRSLAKYLTDLAQHESESLRQTIRAMSDEDRNWLMAGLKSMSADVQAQLGDFPMFCIGGINGSTPSLSMLNRLSAALDYLNTHPACIAVVSGGQGPGENMTEAACMANWLTANGIAPERIIEESRSTSTEENLTFSLALIPNADNARIAVCSSEYHLYRAGRIAQRLGVSVGGVPGRTNLPVLRLNYFIREGLGVLYYSVFGGL